MPEPISRRSKRAVDRLVAESRRFDESFPLTSETVENDPELFEEGVAFFEGGGRGGAGVRVTDEAGRVACIRDPRAPERWSLPAGGHEPGESMRETARRELREETGLRVRLTGVWAAKRKRYVHRTDPERRGYLLSVFFTGRPVGGRLERNPDRLEPDEEILDVAWIDPATADRPVAPLVRSPDGRVP